MTAAFFTGPQQGITIWIVSVGLFLAAALCSAINFSVTAIDLRAKGMTLPRMPLTVWAWLVNAILGMLIFSILLASCGPAFRSHLQHAFLFRGNFSCLPDNKRCGGSFAGPLAKALLVFCAS